MNNISDIDERRRQFLLFLLASGTYATLSGCASKGAITASAKPEEMPAGKSIYKLLGDVRVNTLAATLQTPIVPGDVGETFEKSYIIFVVGKDAYILRSNSKMILPTPGNRAAGKLINTVFELKRGKALAVLDPRDTRITTPSAVIRIRGTGIYIEVEPELSYVCTCYGIADLATKDDPDARETIVSEHHDDPRYILADPGRSNRIVSAPFKNHDDQELLLIETLVGRTTPYVVPQGLNRRRRIFY